MGKFSVEIKWGLIFFVVALAWMYFEKLMGWHGEKIDQHATYTLLFMPIAILMYVLALREKKEKNDGILSWKEGFKAGLVIALVVAVLSPLSQFIVHKVISPDYFDTVIKYSVDNGFLTQEQAETNFNLNSYIWQSVIGAIGAGAITSAIVAIFVRNR
jgi:hypothetical protein